MQSPFLMPTLSTQFSDAVVNCFAGALPSYLQGTVPPCSVLFRSEMGDRKSFSRLAHGGVRMEFPPIFFGSSSGYVKAGLGKNSEVVLPAHASRVVIASTADAISAVALSVDASVAGTNVALNAESGTCSSYLQGTAPPSSILVRSENSVRPISSCLDLGGGEFPTLCSVSGSRRSGKGVFGKGSDGSVAVMPSGDPRACLSMGDRGLPESSSPNWKSLFVGRPKSCVLLVFSSPSRVDGKMIINPPAEAMVEGVGIWEGCLVGQFFDKRLPIHVVRSFVDRLWGKHEIPEITSTNGLYIFRFKDQDA